MLKKIIATIVSFLIIVIITVIFYVGALFLTPYFQSTPARKEISSIVSKYPEQQNWEVAGDCEFATSNPHCKATIYFLTNDKKGDVFSFYENILSQQEWEIIPETNTDTISFKKGNKSLSFHYWPGGYYGREDINWSIEFKP